MNIKFVSTIALALSLSACATGPQTIPITDETALLDADNKVISVTEEGAPFMTWGSAGSTLAMGFGAIGGAISAAMAIEKGKDAVEEYAIPSPSLQIESALTKAVAEKYELNVSDENLVYPLKEKPNKAEKLEQRAGFIYIDAITNLSAGGGNVNLGASMQLIDGATGTLIAGHGCNQTAFGKDDDKPKSEELRANNGERLKSEIAKMADICIEEFKSNILDTAPIAQIDDQAAAVDAE